tara:strand:+ start:66 stop:1667 length:1602 start_codon:yes stop_codon:yes gene_type:complete
MFWSDTFDATPASQPVSIPAPIGGLNARDSLAAMPSTDAPVMKNWWPQPYGVSVRRGYAQWVTGIPAAVKSIASWESTSGGQKLFAWAGANMYDVTTTGVVGAAVVAALATDVWDSVNLVNSAGSFFIALAGNGSDNGIIYDGATYARLSAGDGIVLNTWAGIDPRDAKCPTVHQSRLWVLKRNSSVGYYLPPDAKQGTFVAFDFGPLFSRGGYAQLLCTWTLDDGNGAEDHLIVVSSRGEAAVFAGTNPNNDATWALVGVYFIGAPVSGSRCFTKAGGDVLIVTQQGVVSMTNTLASTKVNEAEQRVTSAKIQFLISELTTSYGSLAGWDLDYFARFNMILLNVPSVYSPNTQLAANQLTNAWTEFNGVAANCWTTFNSSPHFGGPDGIVYAFWTGYLDNVLVNGTGGTGVITSVMQAYSYLGETVSQKQVGMYRPAFITNTAVALNSMIAYDFVTPELTAPTAISGAAAGALWDSGVWDASKWGGGTYAQRTWYQAEGMGVAVAIRMSTASAGEVLWVATDYNVLKGTGIL